LAQSITPHSRQNGENTTDCPATDEFRPGTDFVGKFFFAGVAATVADCGILPRNSTF